MNLDNIQEEWGNHYNTSIEGENLVIQLFKESKYKKIDSNVKRMKTQSVLYMIFNLLVIIYTWMVLVMNFKTIGISIPAVLLILLSKVVFYKNVAQLNLMSKIKYAEPIVKLQKIIEHLKLKRLKHNQFIFILSNLYFWLLMIVFFSMNPLVLIPEIWKKAAIVIIIHVGFSILWFPLSFWILSKYGALAQSSTFWTRLGKNSLLTDESANSSLNRISSFLVEIKNFEKQ
ncbi:uncharacterized membrane protein YhaH (DUF805 family) [Aquimarina sp. EL_43]|uniref:hypothetical protein n=1 Tax=unclassified Aquimarina TaxID=2627091 RepID=UPI0018C980E8|nr:MULTISPECIES: hypothetical protein [unclassified Aquimarina]MBG6128968.1 uncharacterized membrane protein YhaH (DUF805 family) [Aquimarina sp. EL_35]MBG6150032.1 uncharacterized membrane protein YhaH (DUF805 family) [Aquimarina sp. EL_32]MBG6167281.1 uncharacterized membrane protein YhaH (DUF805 family) [Aquimarina sp. EL_43]